MSIEVNWERLTGGPEGDALAESITAFIHDRFQQVRLPRFIRSVQVHSFKFGSIAPQVEVKDVCEPLPDFYDTDDDDDSPSGEPAGKNTEYQTGQTTSHVAPEDAFNRYQQSAQPRAKDQDSFSKPPRSQINTTIPPDQQIRGQPDTPASLSGLHGPKGGIPGGTSNLSYFHLPLSAGLSGASTPMGAGTRFGGSLLSHLQHNASSSYLHDLQSLPLPQMDPNHRVPEVAGPPSPDQNASDLQIVTHLQYDGDVKLSLTAEVMLDYPMESFVGIPLQLNVTGMTFDGVAILAYIKHKAHFCFLAPEDADALIGGEKANEVGEDEKSSHLIDEVQHGEQGGREKGSGAKKEKPVGGLFEEIRVESEIGEREKGRQVLKNIGKVEKFVLDQVRRIFESELVYPSFWTFLV